MDPSIGQRESPRARPLRTPQAHTGQPSPGKTLIHPLEGRAHAPEESCCPWKPTSFNKVRCVCTCRPILLGTQSAQLWVAAPGRPAAVPADVALISSPYAKALLGAVSPSGPSGPSSHLGGSETCMTACTSRRSKLLDVHARCAESATETTATATLTKKWSSYCRRIHTSSACVQMKDIQIIKATLLGCTGELRTPSTNVVGWSRRML